jgi:HPt (histidine-containing phosphotransfer) domain-containing protein
MNRQIDHDGLYDLSYLNQVFQGNQQMIDQIISLFIQQVPSFVHEMTIAVSENRLGDLHPLAHKAKSSVAMLGMKEVEYLFLQVEFCSKNNKTPERLSGMVEQLAELIENTGESLKLELNSRSAA